MKVFVSGTRGFPHIQGGVETHCEKLYPELVRCGCEVTVCRRRRYVGERGAAPHQGVRFLDLWSPRSRCLEAFAHTCLAVLVAAAKRSCDLLHIHSEGPGLCVPLARMLGMKVVFTLHALDHASPKWGPLARAALKLGAIVGTKYAHATIVVSDHLREWLRGQLGVEAHTIPNGVELPPLPSSTEYLDRWGLEKSRYVFTLGRIVKGKGFEDLVEAFAGLETDWKLVIAGDVEYPTAYSRMLDEKARATEGVVMTGFVTGEERLELFAHNGLFVLPSHHEGLPLALLEAMSFGNSVLASDIPGTREVPLPADRFFPPRDVEQLRNKMRHWMARGVSETERQQNLRLLRERYSWDTIARKTLEVYRSVLRT